MSEDAQSERTRLDKINLGLVSGPRPTSRDSVNSTKLS